MDMTRRNRNPMGKIANSPRQAQRRRDEGWQMIAVASEAGFMRAKAGEIVHSLGLGLGRAMAKY